MIIHGLRNNFFGVTFFGDITYDDVVGFVNEFKSIKGLPKNLLILYDLSHAKLNISLSEVKSISKIAEDAGAHYAYVRTAFLVKTPKQTAISSLFRESKERQKLDREMFSTKIAALNWLIKHN